MVRRTTLAATLMALTLAAFTLAADAGATAGPVGPLPPGPVSTISTSGTSLVSVALPKGTQGRVWRQARAINGKVLRQVSEGNVGPNVIVVFRAVGVGSTKVVFGLTRGETRKAYASATFVVHVTR